MEILNEILQNKVLIAGIISWGMAQILKFIIYLIVHKELDFSRLFGDGGMPSGHSATVSSMATMAALVYGLSSFEFAISFMMAIIVMHDAMGVRLETGKQAKVLNELTTILKDMGTLVTNFSEKKLKEFVGHTPLQVVMGCLLGIAIAIIYFVCV